MAADSPNDDRWRDGVVRDRVGVRGGRVGRRVNPPARRMSANGQGRETGRGRFIRNAVGSS